MLYYVAKEVKMQIEGRNQVREALLSGLTVNKLLVDVAYSTRKDDLISLARKKHVRVDFVPKSALDRKSTTAHHQGYIAEATEFKYTPLEEMIASAGEKPFFVLLDGIEDPHNFGAIIRSCECAGVDGIIIPKNRACQVNDTVVRTSTGAIANMKIAQVTNLKEAISALKDNGVWVYAAETGGEDIYSKNLNQPIGIIIGSEGSGVKPSIISSCDGVLSLPLKGSVNSLNASVACGVVVFEILRQRGNK